VDQLDVREPAFELLDLIVQEFQLLILDPVVSGQLMEHQLTVRRNVHPCRFEDQRFLQSAYQRRIFGDIVGRLADGF
jgi:hypothetical protein